MDRMRSDVRIIYLLILYYGLYVIGLWYGYGKDV